MRREFPRVRPVCGVATALAALALSLAGCGASPAAGSASAGATGKAGHPKAASSPDDSLAVSHMKVLTKLKQAQLCGLLSPSAAAKTLGGPLEAGEVADLEREHERGQRVDAAEATQPRDRLRPLPFEREP